MVTLINLGMRRTGLAPGTEDERDLEQVRVAIESIRALMPIVEQTSPEQAGPVREALSQLQLAFVRLGGGAPAGATEGSPGGPPPAGPPPGAPPEGGSPQGPQPPEPEQPARPSPESRARRSAAAGSGSRASRGPRRPVRYAR